MFIYIDWLFHGLFMYTYGTYVDECKGGSNCGMNYNNRKDNLGYIFIEKTDGDHAQTHSA